MSEDTDRLAREADQHRSSVDSTIDQLKSRFSVGQILDEVTSYAKEGQGAELAQNFGRQVRDNPLALGLVGAGLAWLLLGEGVRDQGRSLKHRYDDWRHDEGDDHERDAWRRGRSGSSAYGSDYQEDMAHDFSSRREGPRYAEPGTYRGAGRGEVGVPGPQSTGTSSSSGLTDRAASAASKAGDSLSAGASAAGSTLSGAAASARDAVSGAVHSAADTAQGGLHSLSDAASRGGAAVSSAGQDLSDAAGRAMHDARDAAYRAGDAAYRGASHAGRGAYRMGRRARRSFLDTLQEEPLIVGAVALAIGAAIGASLPPTRQEDELLGEARDRLRDDAYAYGRDAVDKAGHVAEETYKAASQEAENKGLMPSGEGETLAEKVSGVAKTAAETAKSEAKKEGLI